MTTTVLIGTQGNKNVKVKTPNGEQSLNVQEDGDFVTVDAGWSYLPKEAQAPV